LQDPANVKSRLLKLGRLIMLLGYITSTGVTPSIGILESSGPLTLIEVALKQTIQALEFTIPKLTNLAEEASEREDNVQADRIFQRLLDAIKYSLDPSIKHRWDQSIRHRCSTLNKMISFYEKTQDVYQRRKVLQVFSALSTMDTVNLEIDPSRMLAQSLLSASSSMSTAIARIGTGSPRLPVPSPALHQSMRCENPEVFQSVLNFILNASDPLASPHMSPVMENSEERVLTGSRDPNIDLDGKDTLGRTALFLACSLGDEDKCDLLIRAGASIDEMDPDGRDILEVAAAKGLLRTVKSLFDKGAAVNPIRLRYRSSPLQAAAEGGHLEVVEFLLSKGADVHTRRFCDNKTAIEVAQDRGHHIVVTFLREWGNGKRPQRGGEQGDQEQPLQPVGLLIPPDPQPYLMAAGSSDHLPTVHEMNEFFTNTPQDFDMIPHDTFLPNPMNDFDLNLNTFQDWNQVMTPFDHSFDVPRMRSDTNMRM
jgi:hypothetical protein